VGIWSCSQAHPVDHDEEMELEKDVAVVIKELADRHGGVWSLSLCRPVQLCHHREHQGVPQVVSLGALDMVNFGPADTVPEKFRTRNLYKHNPTITLMRTTPEECAELGRRIARKLSEATGPIALYIPLRGISMIATEGGVFYDPEADKALIDTLKAGLREGIEVHEMNMDINDPRFANAMADRMDEMVRATPGATVGT